MAAAKSTGGTGLDRLLRLPSQRAQAVQLQNDKQGIDSSVHRLPFGLAAKHNRRCITKAIALFLRTT